MTKPINSKPMEKEFTLHTMPPDMQEVLGANFEVKVLWDSLTPISQNEWICWVTIVKKPETRLEHLERLSIDLLRGKRRPCCWPGCPHRNPKAAKYFKPRVKDIK